MDWSYIAGYFDGEGHVVLTKARRQNSLHWYNQHRDSLMAMQQFMGCGYIPDRMGGHNRDVSVLVINRRADVLRVASEMLPHLIVKKLRVAEMVDWINQTRDMKRENAKRLPKDPEVIAALYDRGLSVTGIAKLFEVGSSAVSFYMDTHDLARDGRKKMLGIPKSSETRERMRASRRKMWADPEFRASQLATLRAARIARGQIKAPI